MDTFIFIFDNLPVSRLACLLENCKHTGVLFSRRINIKFASHLFFLNIVLDNVLKINYRLKF